MAQIIGFRIQNFKSLRDISLGKLAENQVEELERLTVVIGKNGVGKSSIFDAFGFLSDSLRYGVIEACELNYRGGFLNLRTKGVKSAIEFELHYRDSAKSAPLTYKIKIEISKNDLPYVAFEELSENQSHNNTAKPFQFLHLNKGKGKVWREIKAELTKQDNSNIVYDENSNLFNNSIYTEIVELDDKSKLALATLGSLKENPRIVKFRRFIEGWYLSYFSPIAARVTSKSGAQPRLNVYGNNISNVVQFLEKEDPKTLKIILGKIAEQIPGIKKISTLRTEDNRLLLRFNDGPFKDPFYAGQMSDGTLKLFAYLILLNDKNPPSFMCIEEPENGLYHELLLSLASSFRAHSLQKKGGAQIFITTHQPYFVNALKPSEVWILTKNDKTGYSEIIRSDNIRYIKDLTNQGISLGDLWFSKYFETAN